MIVSLGMYDWAEVQGETDALWAGVRGRLDDGAPVAVDRATDHWAAWRSPELYFGQTCGFPYRTALHGRVTLIGTPDYGLPGLEPGYYQSVLVARADEAGADWRDFLDRRLAINGPDSQSGWAAPQNMAVEAGGRFTRVRETGSHRQSAVDVAAGRADIAAVDAVTWRLVELFRPDVARQLTVVIRTPPTPGLPFITGRPDLAPALFDALGTAIATLPSATTGLRGIVDIPAEAYLAVPVPAPLTDAERLPPDA
jgi:ABC-type phosphate/phosphonate transport system substrate-binding protein